MSHVPERSAPSAGGPDDELKAEVLHDLEESAGPPGRPWYNLIAAAVTAGLGAYALWGGLGYGLGRLAEPGAGMWPFGLGLFVIVMSIAVALRCRRVDDTERFTRHSVLVLLGVLSMLALWLLLPRIGFEIPCLLLSAFWLRVLGRESWRSTAVYSVLIVAAFYVVFVVLLSVPIPRLL